MGTVQARDFIIQPAYGIDAGPVQDASKEISFFELTPRAMIVFTALSISPILMNLIDLLLALKLFVYLGYRKIDEAVIFYNNNRRLIHEVIAGNPGISFSTLNAMTGIKKGVLQYHLHILELKMKIVKYDASISSGYFENNGRWNNLEKSIFISLRNFTTRKILKAISASPDSITRKEVAEMVGITGPSVTWHTNRLVMDGIISISRNGRDSRISISPDAAGIIRAVLGFFQRPLAGEWGEVSLDG
ncbi:MAG: winged helix-turn-helix transcriptional regulator [Methanoregula sp.]|nr:winged helix-turn-helix transcriptional regulator [Methanoregula sp.]